MQSFNAAAGVTPIASQAVEALTASPIFRKLHIWLDQHHAISAAHFACWNTARKVYTQHRSRVTPKAEHQAMPCQMRRMRRQTQRLPATQSAARVRASEER